MNKLFFILVFCMCCNVSLHAQENNGYTIDTVESKIFEEKMEDGPYDDEKPVIADTILRLHPITIDQDSFNNIKNRKAYAYMRNLDSLLKATQQQPTPPPGRVSNQGSYMNGLLGGPVIKAILWILAIVFVCIILYQVLLSRGLFQSRSRSRVSEKTVEETEEISLDNNFDALIQQAYISGTYRLAVRYLFLKTLQQLKDKSYIHYEPDKTNSRYVYEVPVNWRNDFSQLILQYEYVWYGHFDIDKEKYELVQKGFNSFIQKV